MEAKVVPVTNSRPSQPKGTLKVSPKLAEGGGEATGLIPKIFPEEPNGSLRPKSLFLV